MTMNDFTKLTSESKQNYMFSKLCAVDTKMDECLSLHTKVSDLENIIGIYNKRLTLL